MFANELYDESINNVEFDKPKRHVMNKEEFMSKVMEHYEKREAKKALSKQKAQEECLDYTIQKMIYNRKRRNRLKTR